MAGKYKMTNPIRTFMENANLPAVLYHGTSIPNLLSILASRRITASPLGSDDFHEGVSLTRSEEMAERFASHSDVLWWDHNVFRNHEDAHFPMTDGAILVFERNTLEAEHVLTPVDFYGDEDEEDEEEERTDGDIADLDIHLISIKCRKEDIETFQRATRVYPEIFEEKEIEALATLANHPMITLT